MHIHKFAEMAVFDEIGIGGNRPATEEYREFIKKLHPCQMLAGRVTAPVFEVSYAYYTSRGNYRTAKKYTILRQVHEDFDIEIEIQLRDWVEDENNKRPYRKISNVKILEIKPLAYATIKFSM
ncbi:MAG: hypothetical protein ACLUFH_00355 [Monoglobales bacterium]